MNRQGKGGIEWCDYSWNPVVGCTRGCEYCYARRQAKRQKHNCQECYEFTPHFHPERLDDNGLRSKKPRNIFLGSMGELFDPNLCHCGAAHGDIFFSPAEQVVNTVLSTCRIYPQHVFQILTKRPDLAAAFDFPPNVWLGTSIATQADADERIPLLLKCKAAVRFVSYEPMHGPVSVEEWVWIQDRRDYGDPGRDGIDWLILGAETGNRKGKVVPERAWVADAIAQARDAGVPVFVKSNIVKIYPEFAGIQEFPA